MVSRVSLVLAGFALTLVVLILVGYLSILHRESSQGGVLVFLLTSGFEDEIKAILAEDDVLYVARLGSDPHEIQLSPSDVDILKRADLVITMGHTHVDRQVEELVAKGEVKARLLNLLKLGNLVVPELPGGVRNYHEPFYDPRNLVVIIDAVTELLKELRPDKGGLYEEKARKVKDELARITSAYHGLLRGYKAVITTAEIQPAIQWLGVDVVAYVVFDLGESPTPESLEKALRVLSEDKVVLFIAATCSGGTCTPASPLDKRFYDEALQRKIPIIVVPLAYTSGSVVWKLNYILSQVEEQLHIGYRGATR